MMHSSHYHFASTLREWWVREDQEHVLQMADKEGGGGGAWNHPLGYVHQTPRDHSRFPSSRGFVLTKHCWKLLVINAWIIFQTLQSALFFFFFCTKKFLMRNEHMNILTRANELHCGLRSSGVVSWDRSGTLQAGWLIHARTNEHLCLCIQRTVRWFKIVWCRQLDSILK